MYICAQVFCVCMNLCERSNDRVHVESCVCVCCLLLHQTAGLDCSLPAVAV